MKKKTRMLVVCPHPEDTAPGQRLKYEQYFDFFRENGIEVVVSSFISEEFQKIIYTKGNIHKKIFWTLYGYCKRTAQLFTLRRYDIVYVFLWVTPFGPPFFESLYARLSKRLVYDIDDLVFIRYKSRYNKMITLFKGRNKPIFLMKKADHVITCTPYLDQFVKQFNEGTTDISSTVDTDRYKARKDYSIQGQKLVLGWSGSVSTSKYLHLLDKVLLRLKEKIDFKLLVMGDHSFSIPGIETEAVAWSTDIELSTIEQFDIGLYPLPDEKWIYGKSGLKAIQYMGMGIPTVATAIGSNFRVMENGLSGFLVNTEDEWVETICMLAKDKDLRQFIGENARKRVEQRFSIEANKFTYLDILNNISKK